LAALGIAIVRAMAILGFRSIPIYVFAGILVWLAVDASGIHATVTGVILGLMTPARRWVSDDRLYAMLNQVIAHPTSAEGSGDTGGRETLQVAEVEVRETLSPVERLQIALHPWVGFVVMPRSGICAPGRHLVSASHYRELREGAFESWNRAT